MNLQPVGAARNRRQPQVRLPTVIGQAYLSTVTGTQVVDDVEADPFQLGWIAASTLEESVRRGFAPKA
ncbi:hypothetical protein [Pelagibius sp.]|uniref:hypothetical protein n=1 Tax=Pelagibius sp. TaxID=1931238 RepID=UPI003BAB0C57